MSDLHLDCDWSKNMHERLNAFITKLASVAEVRTDQWKLLGFWQGGKQENQEKNPPNRIRTNNKPNLHMRPAPGFEPGSN